MDYLKFYLISALMENYHDEEDCHLPQIIGLTASLGVGARGTSVDAALDHILRLAANLNCHALSVVHEQKDDLNHFVPRPEDGKQMLFFIYFYVKLNGFEVEFHQVLFHLFFSIERSQSFETSRG